MGNVVMLCACLLFVSYLCIMLIMCPCMNFGDAYSVVLFFVSPPYVVLMCFRNGCVVFFVFCCSFTVTAEDTQPKWGKKKNNLYDALPLFHWVSAATQRK